MDPPVRKLAVYEFRYGVTARKLNAPSITLHTPHAAVMTHCAFWNGVERTDHDRRMETAYNRKLLFVGRAVPEIKAYEKATGCIGLLALRVLD